MEYFTHKKRGGKYRILGRGQIQTDTLLKDYDEVVTYQSLIDGKVWTRPSSEFTMDRFEKISDRGDWMQVYSGNKFYPADPHVDDFNIIDIAHSLSMQCRFAGHIEEFYSVAEHSVNVCDLLPEENKLEGLLHDGSEGFISDIVSPAKKELPDYKKFEKKIQDKVYEKFGILNSDHSAIVWADVKMLHTEARQLLKPSPQPWMNDEIESADIVLKCLPPKQAKELFLDTFYSIYRGN